MIMEQFKDGSQSLQRIWAVGLRLIRQIKRDRRTIATVIINPIILMLIMGYSLSDLDRDKPRYCRATKWSYSGFYSGKHFSLSAGIRFVFDCLYCL